MEETGVKRKLTVILAADAAGARGVAARREAPGYPPPQSTPSSSFRPSASRKPREPAAPGRNEYGVRLFPAGYRGQRQNTIVQA